MIEYDFYYGSNQQVTISISPASLLLGVAGGSIFLLAAGIAVCRKIIHSAKVKLLLDVSLRLLLVRTILSGILFTWHRIFEKLTVNLHAGALE